MRTFNVEIVVSDSADIEEDTLEEAISNMLDRNDVEVLSVDVNEED